MTAVAVLAAVLLASAIGTLRLRRSRGDWRAEHIARNAAALPETSAIEGIEALENELAAMWQRIQNEAREEKPQP